MTDDIIFVEKISDSDMQINQMSQSIVNFFSNLFWFSNINNVIKNLTVFMKIPS